MSPSMLEEELKTPFDYMYEEQTLVEALDATVRCARQIPFFRRYFPEGEITSVEQFAALPLTSRTELSMAAGLSELILGVRHLFRSIYPFNQNVCTFPFQVVAGDGDLVVRHERIMEILETAGLAKGDETLILTGAPQYFFASDLCSEIYFEGYHCSIQDVTGMDAGAIRERIEVFGADVVALCTDSQEITPEAIGDSVKAVLTFRGAYPEMARLDATVVDIYSLTEAQYVGHRRMGERFYRYNHDHFFLERSPCGLLTITNNQWDAMPFVRYQTYDCCGEVDDEEGRFEIEFFGEW